MLEEPRRPPGGIRRYSETHARRLRFIRQGQGIGFSLEEVNELLALEDGRHYREAERLGSLKVAAVRERLAQLRQVERALASLVEECNCNTGKVSCPLIAALETEQTTERPRRHRDR